MFLHRASRRHPSHLACAAFFHLACANFSSDQSPRHSTKAPPSSGGQLGISEPVGLGGEFAIGGSSAVGGDASVAGQALGFNPRCSPTADTVWVEEGQPVTAQVKCATGLQLSGSVFAVENVPSGANFDTATATLTWTPSLSQGGVYLLPIAVSQFNEKGTMKIGVVDAFDRTDNISVIDPTTYTEEYELPVLHLTVSSEIERNTINPVTGNVAYVPATIVYRGHTFAAEAKYRGSSSSKYPKRNYSLGFADDDQFSELVIPDAVKSRKHLELITTFDDVSQVRARMAFELWNRMDPSNIRVRQFSLVLFVNGQYWGLYGAVDKVSASLFGHFGYSDLGNLYMGVDHRANLASFRYNEGKPQIETDLKNDWAEGYEKKDGTPTEGAPGAFDDIKSLVKFVASSDEATFESQLPTLARIEDIYNWFIHATAIQAFDTFGKNTLYYRDPIANTPWRIVLWDFNESFGQRWQTARFPTSLDVADIVYMPTTGAGVGYTNRNFLWRRLWNNPTLSTALKARYGSILRSSLSKGAVLALFDEMVAQTAASAKRDDRKWQAQHRAFFRSYRSNDFLDPMGEGAYVRDFIDRRWNALLQAFPQ